MHSRYSITTVKQFSLFIFLLGLCTVTLSQGRYGVSLSKSSIQCLSSKDGILYRGIDNYLKIDPSLFKDCDDIRLESSNGIAVKDSGNQYLLIPERAGKLRLSVECVQCQENETKGYRYFQVANVPDPQLMLNNTPIPNPAQLSKNTLLATDSISIYFNDDLVGSSEWMIITEFELGYNYGGFHVSHLNPSNRLSRETLDIISRIGPDHEISIRPTVKSLGDIRKLLPIYRIRIY